MIQIKQTWSKIAENSTLLTNVLTSLYFILGLIAMLNHSPWRDEINVWLIARDSNSLSELFSNMKYEGHPFIWYICLYVLKHISTHPLTMQIFHLLIATITTYIFLKFSPFKPLHKLIFIIGYFPLYEYLVISRNYAIGILFVFAFCALFPHRNQGYLGLAIILFFMANCNAYSMLLSLALGLTLIIDYLFGKKQQNKWNLLLSLCIFILGITISLAILIPPKDSLLAGGLSGWTLNFDLLHFVRSMVRLWNGYIIILIPSFNQFWTLIIFTIISGGIFGFFTVVFISKPVVLFLYVYGTIEILIFTYLKFLGGARHYGHLYILLIVCFWLSNYFPNSTFITKPLTTFFHDKFTKLLAFTKKYQTVAFLIILYAQMAGGIFTFSRDLIIPFSASKAAGNYIMEQKLDKMFIVGSRDFAVSPICGYINRQIYYPEIKRISSFVLFTKQRQQVEEEEVLNQVNELVKNHGEILLILNKKLEKNWPNLKITNLQDFTNSFNYDERYFLYKIKS